MSGEEAPGGNDYLAFSSNEEASHQKPNHFRPYNNNQWRNSNHNKGNFSPQGFSSPIIGGGGFRGRPFKQDNRYAHGDDNNSRGRNRFPRNFGHQRPYHNNRRDGGGEQQQRSFQNINFQPAGDSGVCIRSCEHVSEVPNLFFFYHKQSTNNMNNYYHPSMTEDPWKHFNTDDVKKHISAKSPDAEQANSDSSENLDDLIGSLD